MTFELGDAECLYAVAHGAIQESLHTALTCQQGLHFSPQRLISAADLIQNRWAAFVRTLRRQVKDLLDLCPTLRSHGTYSPFRAEARPLPAVADVPRWTSTDAIIEPSLRL